MPTLNDLNVFSFDEHAEIPSNFKEILTKLRAIEILETVVKAKLEAPSNMQNRLYFVNARTGSGKSTLMISHFFHKFGKIICSQPRIVLTKTNALDVIRYNEDMVLGTNVSVLNGEEKIYARERTSCTYCTTQILSDQLYKMMFAGRIAKGYKIVVIDECHVLDSALLSLVSVVKRFLKMFSTDARCPLFVFTSATIDTDMMVKFFFPGEADAIYRNPTMIANVAGSPNHPVEVQYVNPYDFVKRDHEEMMVKNKVYNVVFSAMERTFKNKKPKNILAESSMCRYLLKNYINSPDGDCLVFAALKSTLLTLGRFLHEDCAHRNIISFLVSDVTSFEDVVSWRNKYRRQKRFLIIPYARDYSVAADTLLEYATEPDEEAREHELKIIISTPVLETGKTFSNLAFCVDYGLQTTTVFNPLTFNGDKLSIIRQIPANKRQVIQRRGRVGRERPGTFVYFYTEDTYNELPENEFPTTINNYVMTDTLMKIVNSSYKKGDVFDMMNINDFLYNISYDIMLRTIHDVINYGLYSVHGELLGNNMDKVVSYVEYYYLMKNHSLFDSLTFVQLNLYDLPDELHVIYNAPPLKIDFEKANRKRLLEAIRVAKTTIMRLVYDPEFNVYPLMYKRLY